MKYWRVTDHNREQFTSKARDNIRKRQRGTESAETQSLNPSVYGSSMTILIVETRSR